MDRGRNVTAQETVTPSPEAFGKALAARSMLDAVEPLAMEARAAVARAEGHESHACARAKAERLEAAVKNLRDSLRAAGLFV